MLLSANKNRKFVDEFVAVVQPTVLFLLSVINAPIVGKIQGRFLAFFKIPQGQSIAGHSAVVGKICILFVKRCSLFHK